MVAEYLEHALSFERMAASENDPQLKANFEKQAAAYRKLATARAKELGMEPPLGNWDTAYSAYPFPERPISTIHASLRNRPNHQSFQFLCSQVRGRICEFSVIPPALLCWIIFAISPAFEPGFSLSVQNVHSRALYQLPSFTSTIAGDFGFLILIQCGDQPAL
jgi:hypothetical protein